uniref:Uncharacterized protein n=1 Tax=Anguilla anguilla TaxID=7936 RepID=A0A0E9PLJ7_ANGAN
MAKITNAL